MPIVRSHERRRFWHQPKIKFGLAMILVLGLFGFWLSSVFG